MGEARQVVVAGSPRIHSGVNKNVGDDILNGTQINADLTRLTQMFLKSIESAKICVLK